MLTPRWADAKHDAKDSSGDAAALLDAYSGSVIGQLFAHGRVRRAYVGVCGATVPIATRVVRHFGLTNKNAVHGLESVTGSPTARAGVEMPA